MSLLPLLCPVHLCRCGSPGPPRLIFVLMIDSGRQ
jgi:hypothetical protein